MVIVILIFNSGFDRSDMSDTVPVYEIGLSKDDPATELVMSKLGGALENAKKILSEIIEAKISVESQNLEGSRTHYNVTFTVITSKKRLVYAESGWDIIKISDELCRKLEGEFTKHTDNRQRESIRKRGTN